MTGLIILAILAVAIVVVAVAIIYLAKDLDRALGAAMDDWHDAQPDWDDYYVGEPTEHLTVAINDDGLCEQRPTIEVIDRIHAELVGDTAEEVDAELERLVAEEWAIEMQRGGTHD